MSRHEVLVSVDAPHLQNGVAHSGLHQHRNVATCHHLNDHLANRNAQHILRERFCGNAFVITLEVLVTHQVHNEFQAHFAAHRGFTKNTSYVQQQVVCAAQKALAASGEKVKVMSECAADAPADKAGKEAKKDDGHGAKKDAHGKDSKGGKPDEKHAVHWDYEGEMGPENWGKEFPTCGKGKSQSPLNIKGPFEKVRYNVVPDYKAGPLKIVNNGHTIQVNVTPGSKIRIDGKAFDLLQFHFHRPSEEHINGKPSAMVIHFVHKNESGELAVLGVLLQEGNENPGIKTLWSYAPPKEGPEVAPDNVAFNPTNLLPREMEFFHYDGSLTTPPCTEKVKFYILKSQVNISKEQVTQFPFKMNARPVQPLNDRKILTN